jgi:hypothetical protein
MDALANSGAQRRNLESTVCVGTMGPTQTVDGKWRRCAIFGPATLFLGLSPPLSDEDG